MESKSLVLSQDIKAQVQFGSGSNVSFYDVDPIELLNEPFKVIGECINMTDKAQTIIFSKDGVDYSNTVKIASSSNSDNQMRTFGAMVSIIGIVFGGKLKDEVCDDHEPAQKLKAAYVAQGVNIPVLSWQGLLTAAQGMAKRKRDNLANHKLQTIEANKKLFAGSQALVAHNKQLRLKIKAW